MKLASFRPALLHARFASWKGMLFWYRSYRRVFISLFLCVLIAGSGYWYYSLYRYSWNEHEKRTFLESYSQETTLRTERFRKVIDDLHVRQERYRVDPVLMHDFFRLDQHIKKDGR